MARPIVWGLSCDRYRPSGHTLTVIHSGLIEVFGNVHVVMSRAGGSKSRWLVTFINDAASKFITEI